MRSLVLLSGVAAAALAVLGCSGLALPSETTSGPDGGNPAADALAGTFACTETRTWPSNSNGQADYVRKTWDQSLRILVAEQSSTPDFATVSTLKWRYAAEGRIIAYIGVEQPFQHDYRYDDHDNVVDFRLSYPAKPDLLVASSADVWIGTSYQNDYDANGRLASSTVTDYGGGGSPLGPRHIAFHEDTAGRCDRIDTTSGSSSTEEIRSYDANGRLARIDVTGPNTAYGSGGSTQTITYDAEGRVASSVYSLAGPTPSAGGARSMTYTYRGDGTQRVEIADYITDILSERLSVVERSAGCAAIDAAIGVARDNRCRLP